MIHFEDASKEQLLQIALYEACDDDLKYAAIRELQDRYIPEEIRADMIYRLGTGIDIKQVAEENGLTVLQVQNFIRAFQRKDKTDESWMHGYKQTLKTAGRRVFGKGA